MGKKKFIFILLIVIGLLCYIYGFFWFSKINTIIMLLGGYLIFIPLLLIGFDVRQSKKTISNVLIAFCCFFILVITITLVGSLVTFAK